MSNKFIKNIKTRLQREVNPFSSVTVIKMLLMANLLYVRPVFLIVNFFYKKRSHEYSDGRGGGGHFQREGGSKTERHQNIYSKAE